ncbi:MAG TPA: 4Fe-4S binding protein [bacterium (Candidatus Stahlbacteria)]|nr:4Fe-4S binding protein [Candidatus Stahlbacteria bacterium]
MKRRITLLRRVVQIASFIAILYGGFLGIENIKTLLPSLDPDPGEPEITKYERGDILWVAEDPPIFELYPPVATCRFIARGGSFKACFLHMISENLTWLTPLKYLLPHILLFVFLCFLAARFFCGWLCPLGFFADGLSTIRRFFGLSYVELPKVLRDILVKFGYVLLFLTLLLSIVISLPALAVAGFKEELFLPYCQICPARILFPLFGGVTPCWYSFDSTISTVFTFFGWLFLLFFLMSFFIRRLWCRICPIGAIISLFNRGALITKEKDVQKCTRCGACATGCPMGDRGVYEEKSNRIINRTNCIFCFRCVDLCPEDGCLQVKFLRKGIFKSSFKRDYK